jgi:ABC-2 type transport system ATP-binding protein
MEAVVQVDRVRKSFGDRPAVENLSFAVRRGEVFALLGPNGAGKTTLVRMLVGVIRPDEGRIIVTLDGRTTDVLPPDKAGYLPEDRGCARAGQMLRWASSPSARR